MPRRLLGLVSLVWLAIRRRVAPQVGYLLFLLVPLKLLVPLEVAAPLEVARWTPSALATQWLAAPPAPSDSPQQARPLADAKQAASVEILPTTAAQRPFDASEAEPAEESRPNERPVAVAAAIPPTAALAVAGQVPGTVAPRLSRPAMVMLMWLALVVLLAGRFAWAQLRFRAHLGRFRPIDPADLTVDLAELSARMGLRRTVRLVESSELATPAVWGILRPTIILPLDVASALSAEQLHWVLLHELAHVRRRDLPVVVLERVAAVLFFFHPAVWIANRAADRLREYACDDLAVTLGEGSPLEFGQAFVLILRHARRQRVSLGGALGVFGLDSKSTCRLRVGRLLDGERTIRTRLGRGLAGSVAAGGGHRLAPLASAGRGASGTHGKGPVVGRRSGEFQAGSRCSRGGRNSLRQAGRRLGGGRKVVRAARGRFRQSASERGVG